LYSGADRRSRRRRRAALTPRECAAIDGRAVPAIATPLRPIQSVASWVDAARRRFLRDITAAPQHHVVQQLAVPADADADSDR
jgi:hypothetical protein